MKGGKISRRAAPQISSLGHCRREQTVEGYAGAGVGDVDETSIEDSIGSTRQDSAVHFSFQAPTSMTPQMVIHAYPGQGLSPSQLVFALNEELKRVAYCSS